MGQRISGALAQRIIAEAPSLVLEVETSNGQPGEQTEVVLSYPPELQEAISVLSHFVEGLYLPEHDEVALTDLLADAISLANASGVLQGIEMPGAFNDGKE